VLVIPAKAGIQKKLIDFIIELIIETPLKRLERKTNCSLLKISCKKA